MASHRVVIWRGSVSCTMLWIILAVASSLEVYDDVPPVNLDLHNVFQDNNYLSTGPDFGHSNTKSERPPDDLLLTELLNAWRQKMDYTQPWNYLYRKPKLAEEDHRSPGLENVGIVKRWMDLLRGSRLQYRPSQSSLIPQQKWKIKKGKVVGSQMVCYFKLCAFRSPA